MLKGRDKRGRWVKGVSGSVSGAGQRKRKAGAAPTSRTIRDAFYRTFVEVFVRGGSTKELVAFCKKNPTNMKLLLTEVRKLLPEVMEAVDPTEKVPVFKMPRPAERKEQDAPETVAARSEAVGESPEFSPEAACVGREQASEEESKEEAEAKAESRLSLNAKRGAEDTKKEEAKKRDKPLARLTNDQLRNILSNRGRGPVRASNDDDW